MTIDKKRKITVFSVINAIIMVILVVVFILPFWFIFTASFSDNQALMNNGISILFQGFSLDGYKFLIGMSDIFINSLFVSVIVSVGSALLSVFVSMLAAYALSKKYLVGRKFINAFFVVSMFFSGGMIPMFIVVRALGLYDTIWAHILPGTLSVYEMLLMRNYLLSLPQALDDAASLDGANDVQLLWYIYAPLSLPMMFTIGLMTFVTKWNSWLPSLLYFGATNKKLWTAQYVLRQMLQDMQSLYGSSSAGSVVGAPLLSAKNAGIVIIVLPLIIMAPILHKYFSKGILVGAVKG